jgi:uncharacterized protein YbaR (Trm112 family)
MAKDDQLNVCPGLELKCPGCKRPLKVPRIKGNEDKPLICGGCGQRFDCDELASMMSESTQAT